jgi:hypothetical protein
MSSVSRHCVICEKSHSDLCSRCKGVAYCSKECQKADWAVHKLLYATFANFDLSKRPSPDHFRGFHIPEENEKPACIWMKCTINSYPKLDNYSELHSRHENPQTGVVNFGVDDMSRALHISRDQVFGRTLPATVRIHYSDNCADTAKSNRCVQKIYKTNPDSVKHDFKGHFLAVGAYENEFGKTQRRDLDMKDFRHVANYFIAYKPGPNFSNLPNFKHDMPQRNPQ